MIAASFSKRCEAGQHSRIWFITVCKRVKTLIPCFALHTKHCHSTRWVAVLESLSTCNKREVGSLITRRVGIVLRIVRGRKYTQKLIEGFSASFFMLQKEFLPSHIVFQLVLFSLNASNRVAIVSITYYEDDIISYQLTATVQCKFCCHAGRSNLVETRCE